MLAEKSETKKDKGVRLELPDISLRLKEAVAPLASAFDVVVGIGSGGIVPASLVAFELGLPLKIMRLNYRAPDNSPQREKPELLEAFSLAGRQNVLLVDDVSVSGATFKVARVYLQGHAVRTFALKGRADVSLYPEVKSCILLPWRD